MHHDALQRDLTSFALAQSAQASRLSLLGTLMIAAIVWPRLPLPMTLGWTALATISTVGYAFGFDVLRRRIDQSQDPRADRRTLLGVTAMAIALATIQSSLPAMATPYLDSETQNLLTTVYCSWGAGVLISLGILTPAYPAYLATLLGGVALSWLRAERDTPAPVVCAALFVYWVILCVYARNYRAQVLIGITIRAENAVLVRQLSQANEAKNRFILTASHDLRQPLHAIGLLGGVLMRARTREHIDKAREAMSIALDGMNRLFSAILDLSRLDSGTVQPAIQAVPLHALMDRLAAEYQALCTDRGRLWSYTGCRAFARSDPAMLERIVRNLLDNALKHGGHGSVGLTLTRAHDALSLTVWDMGPGIAPEERLRIFDEFYRVEHSQSSGLGLGLGLSIVQRLAGLLDVSVDVDYQDPVRKIGTCIALRLPCAAEVATDPAGPIAPPDVAGLRVLVLDDDPHIRNATRALLEQWNCKAATCANREEALHAARALGPPQLALTDYRLGQHDNGLDALAVVRSEFPEMGLVIVTGESSADTLKSLRDSGFLVLNKPVNPDDLRVVLGMFISEE